MEVTVVSGEKDIYVKVSGETARAKVQKLVGASFELERGGCAGRAQNGKIR